MELSDAWAKFMESKENGALQMPYYSPSDVQNIDNGKQKKATQSLFKST